MKKIRINEEGKQFSAYLQMLLTDGESNIVGMALAGNRTSIRAIHGSLYNASASISLLDEETESMMFLDSIREYKRLEVVNGKVIHAFFLPRSAVQKEFEKELQEAEQENKPKPERIIISKRHSLNRDVGLFLADTYGLPQTDEWVERYFDLLPDNKWDDINVMSTELSGEKWQHLGAVKIHAMEEEDVLEYINIGIKTGVLITDTDLTSDAEFHEGMTTEEYLQTNAQTLAAHIDKYMEPMYKGDVFERSVGETKRVSLPAQARSVMGSLEILKHQNSAFMVANMGSGSAQRF